MRTYGDPGLVADGCFASGESARYWCAVTDLWLLTSPESRSATTGCSRPTTVRSRCGCSGQGDRLVWYVADVADLAASDGVRSPRCCRRGSSRALFLLAASVLALVLWRGRRLGPLVTEPLPVVVRAAESTRSRGRIYHRTSDRQHAAAVLVGASRRRLADAAPAAARHRPRCAR